MLNPRLTEIAIAIRRSGIAPRTRLITNSTLLARLTPELLEQLDEVHFSIYPGFQPDSADLASAIDLCLQHNVATEVKNFAFFREPLSTAGAKNPGIVGRIYATCKMAHSWDCHTVEGAFFYKCPQSLFLAKAGIVSAITDRLAIDDRPSFSEEIHDFLMSPSPLQACANCLGSVGRLFRHQQLPRVGWWEPLQRCTEDLIDMTYLEAIEEDVDLDNLCVESEWDVTANSRLVSHYGDIKLAGNPLS